MSFLDPLPHFSSGSIVSGFGDSKGMVTMRNTIVDRNGIHRGRINEQGKVINEYGMVTGHVKNGKVYDMFGNYKGTI